MLWAALYFPDLILARSARLPVQSAAQSTVQPATRPSSRPVQQNGLELPRAIIESKGAKRLVMSCDSTAREYGIDDGMALNAAYAICPQLETSDYDEVLQQQYLEELCLWALQYSSWVTPCMPDTVMLEIKASLSLFGGLPKLLNKLASDMSEQQLSVATGVAPTPAAARLLSRINYQMQRQSQHKPTQKPTQKLQHKPHKQRAQQQKQTKANIATTGTLGPITKMADIESVFADLPVDCLPLNEFTRKGLRQSGIKRCAQLFELPASALTRRFGEDCTTLLYRLLGRIPEPCPALRMPDHFLRSLDLPLEAPDTNALQFPLNRLLSALGGYLRASDSGVKQLKIALYHPRCKASIEILGFLEATADHKHLLRVATERLAAMELPEPVTAVTIEALETDAITRSGKDLFNKSESQSGTIEQALDLLSARIGRDKVYTPSLQQDHRPENAWAAANPAGTDGAPWPTRPLWLLPEARASRQALTLMSQPERIENGWWDTNDVRRDYFIAKDSRGAWVWAYCERQSGRAKTQQEIYYIHGLFA